MCLRARSVGKIAVGTAVAMCVIVALIYALASPSSEHFYKSLRAITYAILALTFAVLYRYFED